MSFNVRVGSAAMLTARCGCRMKVPSRVLLRLDAVFDVGILRVFHVC